MAEESGARSRPRTMIRDSRNGVAGGILIAIAAFAWWASSDLPLGQMSSMEAGMLPRIYLVAIGLLGVALAASSLILEGEGVRSADLSATMALGGIAIVSVIAGNTLPLPKIAGWPLSGLIFVVLLSVAVCALAVLAIRNPDLVDRSGLRGPMFVFAGIIAFALTIKSVGLLLAGPLLAMISGAASPETKPKELLLFALSITLLCAFLFKYALKLALPILVISPLNIHW